LRQSGAITLLMERCWWNNNGSYRLRMLPMVHFHSSGIVHHRCSDKYVHSHYSAARRLQHNSIFSNGAMNSTTFFGLFVVIAAMTWIQKLEPSPSPASSMHFIT
jgi:hypothetical protein